MKFFLRIISYLVKLLLLLGILFNINISIAEDITISLNHSYFKDFNDKRSLELFDQKCLTI